MGVSFCLTVGHPTPTALLFSQYLIICIANKLIGKHLSEILFYRRCTLLQGVFRLWNRLTWRISDTFRQICFLVSLLLVLSMNFFYRDNVLYFIQQFNVRWITIYCWIEWWVHGTEKIRVISCIPIKLPPSYTGIYIQKAITKSNTNQQPIL
jgi:hypothetical protein